MENKKNKQENKIWKWFRHLASLGVGGAMLFLFPNFVITQLSFLVGILVGKGILSASLGFAITTFLGSQAGLWLQKGILALLSYIISNLTLKLSGKLFKTLTKNDKNNHKVESIQLKNNNTQKTNNKKSEYSLNNKYDYEEQLIEFNANSKKHVKRLGKHPSFKK